MDEIERMIRSILSKHNLSDQDGRDAAYEECLDFAEKELAADIRCNTFLRRVSEMLEKDTVEYDVVRDMVEMPDDAILDISYDDKHGFVLTGNYAGLNYFSDLLKTLASAPAGEHVHLFNDEEPLTLSSFNTIVYVEDDDWFDKQLAGQAGEEANAEHGSIRRLTGNDVFALQIVGDIPHNLTLTRDKLYRVEGSRQNGDDEEIWRKSYNGNDDRYLTFQLTDDHGETIEIILHLDDPDVNYFKKSDLAELLE